MAKPFNATTRELLASDPRAWLELLLGRELGDVRILNVDLSTITTEADLVLLVQAPAAPALQHPGELPTPAASAKHGTAPLS